MSDQTLWRAEARNSHSRRSTSMRTTKNDDDENIGNVDGDGDADHDDDDGGDDDDGNDDAVADGEEEEKE
eukprot:8632022-Pyramimonas_sp.AAC.1